MDKGFSKEKLDPGAKDLSQGKQTHLSASLHGQMEFHLENDEIKPPKGFKEKKDYWVSFPVKAASKDDKGHRYRTQGLPVVHPREEAKPVNVPVNKKNKHSTQVYKGGY